MNGIKMPDVKSTKINKKLKKKQTKKKKYAMIFCMCILITINYAMNLVLLLKYSRKSHLLQHVPYQYF